MTEYKRYDGETDEELIYRITSEKDKIGSWQGVADILNELLGTEYTESKFRKQRQAFDKMFSANQAKFSSDKAILDDIAEQRRELEISKIKFRDERNAWQKQNYTAARVEQKLDYLEDVLKEQGKVNFEVNPAVDVNSECDMLVMLSDLHIGQCFDSMFGKYNSDIAKERLEKYLEEIIKIQKRHNCEKCFVSVQGDLLSGSIHKALAITNRENVIEQVKIASSLISSFCYELTKHFKMVYMQDCSGNHTRIDRKEDALHSERLDDLIAWNVEHILSHIDNFHVLKRKLDIGIADFNIRGKSYIAVHGDYDNFSKQGVADLSFMLGFIPYAVLCGHRHFPAMSDFNGVKMIQCGSLAGSGDDYTIEKRLTGKASQTVCICTYKGIECYYPIELN